VVLPPTHCTSISKYIDTGKICCEQQGPHEFSTPVCIHSGYTAHKEARIDPGHVGILSSECQGKTGTHSEHKAHKVKPKRSAIGVKTGTPEIFIFCKIILSQCGGLFQQSQTVTRSQERFQVVLNLSQPC
jgi:hypothetical protein